MAKRSTTKSAIDEVAVTDNSSVTATIAVEADVAESNKKEVKTKKEIKELNDTDEIEVISLIPNVYYKDKHDGDLYVWEEVGHIEYLTFATLKNMWREAKGYFRDFWLKPNDDRVIEKFKLQGIYDKYDFLMCKENYTKQNVEKICSNISSVPNGVKFTICNKIKNWIALGDIADVSVVIRLGRYFDLDLISLLD